MATTKPITARQFESLLENLDSYNCTGFSHNVGNEPSKWDTLLFKYDGSPEVGVGFHLSHPLTPDKSRIDYNTIDVSFGAKYPIEQRWSLRVTNPAQVERLTKAVAPYLEQYRQSLILGHRPSMSMLG